MVNGFLQKGKRPTLTPAGERVVSRPAARWSPPSRNLTALVCRARSDIRPAERPFHHGPGPSGLFSILRCPRCNSGFAGASTPPEGILGGSFVLKSEAATKEIAVGLLKTLGPQTGMKFTR